MMEDLLAEHGFLVLHEYSASRNIIWEEELSYVFIVLSSNILNKEILCNWNSTIETYLFWKERIKQSNNKYQKHVVMHLQSRDTHDSRTLDLMKRKMNFCVKDEIIP